jgi:FkbM family methyltransferase
VKKLARKFFTGFLKPLGFEINYVGNNPGTKNYCANEYSKQAHLEWILETCNIDCILDVGANQGQYAKELRSLGYRGHIISFEPVSETYSILKKLTAKDSKWSAYNFALGSENKTMEINLFETSLFNSFLPPSDLKKEFFKKELFPVKKEVVQVKTLDSIFDEVTEDIVSECRLFIKLDTQGFDLEVIKGGQITLKKALCLQSEISCVPLYKDMPHYIDSLKTFEALGFHLTNFFPLMGIDVGSATIEFDCFMISANALSVST